MNPDTWADRFRTPSGRKRPTFREQTLQRQLAEYLRAVLAPPPEGPIWTAINPAPFKSKAVAGISRAMGLNPGWPDLVLFHQGKFLALEVKVSSTLSPDQRQFRLDSERHGASWFLIRSIDDLAAALDAAGIPRRDRRS